MAEIFINKGSLNNVEKQINSKISNIMSELMKKSKLLLFEQSEVLFDAIAKSPEYNSLKDRFVGEFGFTKEEIGNIDRILTLLLPQNDVTKIEIKVNGPQKTAILHWVDYDELKKHEFAQHPLTKFIQSTGSFVTTQIVSWVEWFEEGVTVQGFEVEEPVDPASKDFSRSGRAIMRAEDGGMWSFRPTDLFHKTGNSFNNIENFKKGIGLLIKKIAKEI